jgi:hypothetical protein
MPINIMTAITNKTMATVSSNGLKVWWVVLTGTMPEEVEVFWADDDVLVLFSSIPPPVDVNKLDAVPV